MKRFLECAEQALARPAAGWVLAGLTAVLYAAAYRLHPLYPGTGAEALQRGWWTWNDQLRYWQEAAAIAQGRFGADAYHYPIGYPALGAVFWRWMPAHPFFIPNLVLFVGSAALWWRIARRWFSRVGAFGVALAFVGLHRWLIADSLVVPWNTLATQLALWAGIWVVLENRRPSAVWWLSLLAGAAYVIKSADAVAFAPLLVWSVVRLGSWRDRLLHGLGGIAVVGAAVGAVATINLVVVGSWQSPYDLAAPKTVGFFSYPISHKLFWLLVDGRPLFHEVAPALLLRYAWLFAVPAAVVFWLRRDRGSALAILLSISSCWFLYLNYNDFHPGNVYRFTLIHYLAWSFPILFLAVAAACRHGWAVPSVRAGFAFSLALFISVSGLRLEPTQLPTAPRTGQGWRLPASRPLLLRFEGMPREAISRVRLEGRPLVAHADYLSPYGPFDLQFMLGFRARGELLTVEPGTPDWPDPTLVRFGWRWRFNPTRLKRIGQ